MEWLDETLRRLEKQSLLRVPTALQPDGPTRARLGDRVVHVFCGNDYLGLRHHPALAHAAAEAARHDGAGSGASRLVSGNTPLHEATEHSLAELVRRPAALIASSGYAANTGALAALLGPEDVAFSDELNHASIIDGCRLSRARVAVYHHADPRHIAEQLPRLRPYRRAWVITESLFSMDGDAAPLPQLRQLCDREGLHLYVDEAHAVGVFGPDGAGLAAEANIATDVLVGTLDKALGSGGAFIAGTASLRQYLWNHCRSFVFSTGLAPPLAAAAQAAVELVRTQPEIRERLRANVHRLRSSLARAGLRTPGHPDAPIVPVVLHDDARAVAISQRLLREGFFVQAIRPPTVPRGTARLRITVSAAHEPDQIDAFVAALVPAIGEP